jgi:hypothetical protein
LKQSKKGLSAYIGHLGNQPGEKERDGGWSVVEREKKNLNESVPIDRNERRRSRWGVGQTVFKTSILYFSVKLVAALFRVLR